MIPRTDQQRKYFHAVVLPAVAQGLGREGVQHPEWNKLQQAKEVLDKHHGL